MPAQDSAALDPGVARSLRGRFRLVLGLGIGWVLLVLWVGLTAPVQELVPHPAWVFPFTLWAPFVLWMPGWPVRLLLHILLGAGAFALGLWTLRKDRRPGVRGLGMGLLMLLAMEAVLGGARLVWASAKLSMLHAAIDPLFFAILVALGVFASRTWVQAETVQYAADQPAPTPLPTGLVLGLLSSMYLLFLGAAALPPAVYPTAPPGAYAALNVLALGLVGGCAALAFTRPATAYPRRQWAGVLAGAAGVLVLTGAAQMGGVFSPRLVYLLQSAGVGLLWGSAGGFALWALRTDPHAAPAPHTESVSVPHPASSGSS